MSEQTLYYHDGVPMLLGDQIRARAFLIPIRGKVVYVTGQSDPLPDFDWPLMASFAIELRSGRTVSWTRPRGARLEKHFRLVSREHAESMAVIPNRVEIQAHTKRGSAEGVCVCLRFEMQSKNDFTYVVFLNSNGAASVSGREMLKRSDEDREMFIMDYHDLRVGFTGKITAKVLDLPELKRALEAFKIFQGYPYPENYEDRLKQAIQRGQNPADYQLEVVVHTGPAHGT